MASYRFSSLANRLVRVNPSIIPQGGLNSAIIPADTLIAEGDIQNMIWSGTTRSLTLRTVGVLKTSLRNASVPGFTPAIPTNVGKQPPTLEEFDPLNPGEWQLGAGGKILPRLPEGTRVGKLVMGKYGLYDPKLRKRVNTYAQGLLDGKKSEEAGPFDYYLSRFVRVVATISFMMGLWNLFVLFHGKLIWPFAHHKVPGSTD
ncbi:hypothetical protein AB6A40_005279 [Gnathostoma spinigerum]|uniref:Uncharacterized protein n=1 Tax=Gnathostoma spinigerum TaxID=75299 RepID=A0ABD6EQN5_9BILA